MIMLRDAPSRTWTLVSYNVRSCRGLDRRTDPLRIAAVIRELSADVIALQEVASRPGRANDTRQLSFLAEATGLNAVAGPTLLRSDAPCGTALLTSHPVLRVRRFDLSVSGREPRGALDVDLDVDGTVLRVVNMHLGLRMRERRMQIAKLLDSLPSAANPIMALTGDFNEWWPFSAALKAIDACFTAAPAASTFPSVLPLLALDRLWLRSSMPLDVDVKSHRTALTRVASDHLPLLAKLRLLQSV